MTQFGGCYWTNKVQHNRLMFLRSPSDICNSMAPCSKQRPWREEKTISTWRWWWKLIVAMRSSSTYGPRLLWWKSMERAKEGESYAKENETVIVFVIQEYLYHRCVFLFLRLRRSTNEWGGGSFFETAIPNPNSNLICGYYASLRHQYRLLWSNWWVALPARHVEHS